MPFNRSWRELYIDVADHSSREKIPKYVPTLEFYTQNRYKELSTTHAMFLSTGQSKFFIIFNLKKENLAYVT